MKFITVLKTGIEWFFIALVCLAILPIILGALVLWFLIFGVPMAYTDLWSRIRHDPKVSFTVEPFEDDSWDGAYTKDAFLACYDRLSKTISRLSGAEGRPVNYRGFEVFEGRDRPHEWKQLSLRQTFMGKGMTANIRLNFGAIAQAGSDEPTVMLGNSDTQDDTDFPPVLVSIIFDGSGLKRRFSLTDAVSAWFLIGVMRGDYRFNDETGQLWAYLEEEDVWIVEYKANKNNYGVRRQYSLKRALKYRWDGEGAAHKNKRSL